MDNLKTRWAKHLAAVMFKSVHYLGPPYLSDIFVSRNYIYNTRSGNDQLILNCPKTEYGKRRFLFQGGKLWNKLITYISPETSLTTFSSSGRS